jgi:hypothetical protein
LSDEWIGNVVNPMIGRQGAINLQLDFGVKRRGGRNRVGGTYMLVGIGMSKGSVPGVAEVESADGGEIRGGPAL